MAHSSYEFAILRIAPDEVRDERVNVGVVVFHQDGIDLRLAIRPQKLRALSGNLHATSVQRAASLLTTLDESRRHSGSASVDERYATLSRVGMFALSNKGQFVAQDEQAYEARVASLLRSYVETEAAHKPTKEKRSGLLKMVKQQLKKEGILALKDEGLASHRIVPRVKIADGLVADLALQNSVMHVVETVDAPYGAETLSKVIGNVGVSALVLERARLSFGDKTKSRLVYAASTEIEAHVSPVLEVVAKQGIELINWNSDAEQKRFLVEFANLATRVEKANLPSRRMH